ncbi:LysR family transcriptional regulator [Paraburkholderia sp. BR10937]|uniref:LysR family transcriptional regulator n=1 Tax=Paraburkholderia sp. BR10937 TaxID=3236994 RepID=UPI0034D30907
MKSLDVDAVQAFVLVAELKSFTRAAQALDTTQSSISLRIKRLEEALGRHLVERTPRQVCLSVDGVAFLEPARALVAAHRSAVGAFGRERRRLVIGMSHHVVGAQLPFLLRRVSDANPDVLVELRIEASRYVLAAFDEGKLDAAIVLQHGNRRLDGETILTESFGWVAARDFEHDPARPLRLATQPEPCSVRSMAIDALDEAGIAWTEVFLGGGVATIGAAVSAGVAVAALGLRVAPSDVIDVGGRLGLPPLPSRDVVLYASQTDVQARCLFRSVAEAIASTVSGL